LAYFAWPLCLLGPQPQVPRLWLKTRLLVFSRQGKSGLAVWN
jgi:hypothetical protein